MTTQIRLIRELIETGERVVRAGLVQASGGNLSARLPGTGRFVVTKRGTWLDALAEPDFVTGSVEDGMGAAEHQASIEWKLHARTYAARPDIGAIVHLHPQHVLLLSVLGEPIRFVTLDHQFYVGSVRRVPFLPAGSEDLARAAADAARECDAVVLDHHGSSTLGEHVAMALRRALNLEEAARMTYRLLLAGNRDGDFPHHWRGRIIET